MIHENDRQDDRGGARAQPDAPRAAQAAYNLFRATVEADERAKEEALSELSRRELIHVARGLAVLMGMITADDPALEELATISLEQTIEAAVAREVNREFRTEG